MDDLDLSGVLPMSLSGGVARPHVGSVSSGMAGPDRSPSGALGIGGLAIGLALNSSLANIFGGIQLILDRSLIVGDKIMLDSGEVGVVLDSGLRSTKMRTYDNEVIFLPNSQLANTRVKNLADAVTDIGHRVWSPLGMLAFWVPPW